MKATLEFNLPEETEEFELAKDGHKWHRVVCEIKEHLRNKVKYEQLDEKTLLVYEDMRTMVFEICRELGAQDDW